MRSYIYDEAPACGDQRQPHDSGRAVPLSRLQQLGVLPHPNIDLPRVDAIAEERGYACRDEITVSRAGLGDAYEAKIKSFFAEHLHGAARLAERGLTRRRGRGDPLHPRWVRLLRRARGRRQGVDPHQGTLHCPAVALRLGSVPATLSPSGLSAHTR